MSKLSPGLIFAIAERAAIKRLRGSTDAKWVVQCVDGSAHKHGDKHPSAFLDGTRNCFSCSACGLKLSARDLAARMGVEWSSVRDGSGAARVSRPAQRQAHSAPALDLPAAWSSLPSVDANTREYLQTRGLLGAIDFCRSVPRTAPDMLGKLAADGFRLALALRDAAGRVVAIQVLAPDRKEFRTIGPSGGAAFGSPERLSGSATVVICEGLTDTLAALVATGADPSVCVLGIAGAETAQAVNGLPLDAKRVVIATDADEPGDRAALNIATALEARGVSCFRARPTRGKDLCDMIGAGDDITKLIRDAPAFQALPTPAPFAEPIRAFLGDNEDVTDAPEPFLIAGLLPVGVPAALAGEPKTLKTYVAIDMGVCVAAGIPWCDRQTKQGRVVLYLEEDGRSEIRRRLWRLARGHGLDPRELPISVTAMAGLRLDEPEHVARIIAECRGAALVVIDALSRVHSADENDRTAMRSVTLALSRVVAETGATVLVVHHYRKADSRSSHKARPGQQMRGTGDLHALMRAVIGIEKLTDPAGYTEIQLTPESNYGEPVEPFALRFTNEQHADGKHVAQFTTKVWLSADEKTALGAIRAGATSIEKIRQAKGGKTDRWRSIVHKLVERELVTQQTGQPLRLTAKCP